MSEAGKLALEQVTDLASVQRNLDRLARQQVGRGPAQARVYNNANITVGTGGAGTALTFNSERWDTGNYHSTSANTDRLTAPTAGLYQIGGCVRWDTNATGIRAIWIEVTFAAGGTAIIDERDIDIDSAANHTLGVGTQYQLAAGDYVRLVAFQNSGGNLNVLSASNRSPEFWIVRLGSQA